MANIQCFPQNPKKKTEKTAPTNPLTSSGLGRVLNISGLAIYTAPQHFKITINKAQVMT
jgi:hypothetical protein